MKLILIFSIIIYLLSIVSSQSSVTLNWIDTSNSETGFGIERATGSGSFSYLSGVSANIQTYNDATVQNSNIYSYIIYSWNSYGNSTYSNTVTVSINSQGQGTQTSSGGGSSGGLTATVTPSTGSSTNSGTSGNSNPVTGNSVNNEENQNSRTIAGRAVDGASDDGRILSPLAVYSTIGLLIGIVLFIVVWKKMNNITVQQDV